MLCVVNVCPVHDVDLNLLTLRGLSSSLDKNEKKIITSKIPLKLVPIKTMLKLFDACITPLLLYVSEIWGAYANIDHNKWKSIPIEEIHTQLLKKILGLNRSTTNILVSGEIGRHCLQAYYILNRNINYIKYLENKFNTKLVKQALNYEQSTMDCRPTVLCVYSKLVEMA